VEISATLTLSLPPTPHPHDPFIVFREALYGAAGSLERTFPRPGTLRDCRPRRSHGRRALLLDRKPSMLRNPFSFAVLALSAALFAGSAAADNWKDCAQLADPGLTIRGCSAILESGREMAANRVMVYNNRGNAYQNKDEVDRAIADYSRAIALDPNYANAYNNRGLAYQKKGKVDRAIADFSRAIELDPNNAAAYNNRGNAYDGKGEHGRAIADYRRALSKNPGDQDSKDALKRLGVEP
jgi:tetratricopeptide (TPR) repeat protein